jgi:hypothetical protein
MNRRGRSLAGSGLLRRCWAPLALIPWLAAAAGAAPELRQLELPEDLAPTPKVMKLLAEGNEHIVKGYALLVEQNQPGPAMREFQKALAIQAKLDAMTPHPQQAGVSEAEAKEQAKAFKMAAAMEHLTEIAKTTKPQEQVEEKDKEQEQAAKDQAQAHKAAEAQKQITKELAQAKPEPATPDAAQPPKPQTPKPDASQPPKPDAAQPPKPDVAQPPKPDASQPPKPDASRPPKMDASQPPKPDATQRPKPDASQPPKPDASQPPKTQNPEDAKLATAPPPKHEEGGAPHEEHGGAHEAKAAAAPTKQAELAARQQEVAEQLQHLAEHLTADKNAAQAFAEAAHAAAQTAQMIAAGKIIPAQPQSAEVERAIAAAIRLLAAAGNSELGDLVHDLQLRLSDLKDQQSTNLADLQELQKPAAGGEADRRDRGVRAALVAAREAALKQDIDSLEKDLAALAAPAGQAADRSHERAAREDLGQALQILREAKTRQQAIDATMDVRGGEFKSAASSMALAHKSLGDCADQVAAAAAALSAGASQAQRDYQALQRVSSGLRQIANAAGAFASPPVGTDKTASTALPPAVAQVFDASLSRLHRDLLDTVGRPAAAPMPGLAEARRLAQPPLELTHEPRAGLEHLQAVIAGVEALEGQLAAAIEKDQQRAATRDFLKDLIPPAYQKPVSQYFEVLSKD